MEVPLTFSNGQIRYFNISSLHTTDAIKENEYIVDEDLLIIDAAHVLSSKEIDFDDGIEITEKITHLQKRRLRLKKKAFCTSQLFVDKYKPREFHQLISNPKMNRLALAWLLSWKDTVFGGSSKFQTTVNALNGNKPPVKKLLLLNGPPGIGKTTLARVVAQHAGYNPVEINASNDRTSVVLLKRIESSLQNRQLDSKKFRLAKNPELIILDECDGLDRGFISKLIQILEQDRKSERLNKPIILISNEYYKCKELRRLASFLEVLNFHMPRDSTDTAAVSLIHRLEEIAVSEAIIERPKSMDSSTKRCNPCFQFLAELFNYDFRLCLNALQLIQQHAFQHPVFKLNIDSLKSIIGRMNKGRRGSYFDFMTKIQNHKKIQENHFESQDYNLLLNGLSSNFKDICRLDSLLFNVSLYLEELSNIQTMSNNHNISYFENIYGLLQMPYVSPNGYNLGFPSDILAMNKDRAENKGRRLEASLLARIGIHESTMKNIAGIVKLKVVNKVKQPRRKRARDFFPIRKPSKAFNYSRPTKKVVV